MASTSWSFPIACIALVWRTRKKGTECLPDDKDQQSFSHLRFFGWLSLTVVVATPIAIVSSGVVVVAVASISAVALLSTIAVALVTIALVPVVVVSATLVPILALT